MGKSVFAVVMKVYCVTDISDAGLHFLLRHSRRVPLERVGVCHTDEECKRRLCHVWGGAGVCHPQ